MNTLPPQISVDLGKRTATLVQVGKGQKGRTLMVHYAVEGAELVEANRLLLAVVCEPNGCIRAHVFGITMEETTEVARRPTGHSTILMRGARFSPAVLEKHLQAAIRYMTAALQRNETFYFKD